MNSISLNPPVKLAPPGAGLPWLHRLMARYYIGPWVSKRNSWSENIQRFHQINEKLIELVETLPADLAGQPILVKPLPGLEDSSRFWSVAMVLDHLLISGLPMKQLVILLSQQKTSNAEIRIAEFKPQAQREWPVILNEYKAFAKNAMNDIEQQVGSRQATALHRHPWFGMMNVAQWHWLLGQHTLVHYIQLKEILKALTKN